MKRFDQNYSDVIAEGSFDSMYRAGKSPRKSAGRKCGGNEVNVSPGENSFNVSELVSKLKEEILGSVNSHIDHKFEEISNKLQETTRPAVVSPNLSQQNPSLSSYASVVGTSNSPVFTNRTGTLQDVNPVYVSNKVISSTNSSQDVIILSPTDNSKIPKSSEIQSVKKALSEKLKNVPFSMAPNTGRNGRIAVRFPNKCAQDEAIGAMNDDDFLDGLGFNCKEAPKMLPKITLYDVPAALFDYIDKGSKSESEIRDLHKTAIVNEIQQKNHQVRDLIDLGHSFSVVYVGKLSRQNCVNVGIKLSPAIRSLLFGSMNGTLYMHGKRIRVEDRFHVKQCFHCQLFNHISDDCPNKINDPTCLYCMGSHRSSSCSFKNVTSRHACAKCFFLCHHTHCPPQNT